MITAISSFPTKVYLYLQQLYTRYCVLFHSHQTLPRKEYVGLKKSKQLSGHSRSPWADCTRICDRFNCKYCQDHSFFCSSKYTRLSVGMKNLKTIVALVTGIFPLQIDSTLVIGALCGLITPPCDVTQPESTRIPSSMSLHNAAVHTCWIHWK